MFAESTWIPSLFWKYQLSLCFIAITQALLPRPTILCVSLHKLHFIYFTGIAYSARWSNCKDMDELDIREALHKIKQGLVKMWPIAGKMSDFAPKYIIKTPTGDSLHAYRRIQQLPLTLNTSKIAKNSIWDCKDKIAGDAVSIRGCERNSMGAINLSCHPYRLCLRRY